MAPHATFWIEVKKAKSVILGSKCNFLAFSRFWTIRSTVPSCTVLMVPKFSNWRSITVVYGVDRQTVFWRTYPHTIIAQPWGACAHAGVHVSLWVGACCRLSHQRFLLFNTHTRGYKDGLQPESLADGNWLVKQNQLVSKIETKSDTNLRSLYEFWFRNALISKSVILWWQAKKGINA